jgi:hypothetical protein
MNMNFINALAALSAITEGGADYQEEYKKYILDHKKRVKKFADWLKENLPELFEEIDIEIFDDMIDEHDDSKFSEEEFEAYAQYFYGTKDNDLEFNEAWKHHWINNEHHPEFWLGEDMPYIYILEMICDWGSFSIDKGDLSELIDFYYNKARDDEEKMLSDNTKLYIEEILDQIESVLDSGLKENYSDSLKQKQLEIIFDANPAPDEYHTWIRTVDDILTFEEALNSPDYIDYRGEDFDESYPYYIAEDALKTGKIKVYSSYKIEPGVFVTPSRLEAMSYSGSKNIFSKEINLIDVAWIDPTQGIYTGQVNLKGAIK